MPKVEFEDIYDQHYQTIFNYCLRRTGNFEVSRDITSETFLKAFLNLSRFTWKGIPILNWLYRIAGNEIKLFYRAKKYRAQLIQAVYFENPLSDTPDLEEERERAEHEYERHNQFLKVQKAVQMLPGKYQEVISLKYFEQLTISEIGLTLNKKEGTVKSLLSRGIKKLKALVKCNL